MTLPLDCNINQQDLSELRGYSICVSDFITFLEDKEGAVNVIDLLDMLTATNSIINSIVEDAKASGDYTRDMTDKEAPGKYISGPDALLLKDNPVFEGNYTQGIIDRLNEQLGLNP